MTSTLCWDDPLKHVLIALQPDQLLSSFSLQCTDKLVTHKNVVSSGMLNLNSINQYIQQQRCPFNGPLSGTTWVSWYQYQKGKTCLDFTEARDSEWRWHQLGYMQVCTSHDHASTPPVSFFQVGYPSCCPNNGIKTLKAIKSVTY